MRHVSEAQATARTSYFFLPFFFFAGGLRAGFFAGFVGLFVFFAGLTGLEAAFAGFGFSAAFAGTFVFASALTSGLAPGLAGRATAAGTATAPLPFFPALAD